MKTRFISRGRAALSERVVLPRRSPRHQARQLRRRSPRRSPRAHLAAHPAAHLALAVPLTPTAHLAARRAAHLASLLFTHFIGWERSSDRSRMAGRGAEGTETD